MAEHGLPSTTTARRLRSSSGIPSLTRVVGKTVSRGEVVSSVSTARSPDFADAALAESPRSRMNPFRLIGIFPKTGEVIEWRWNLKKLARKNLRWKTQQWISSGFDEATAQRVRGKTFQRSHRQFSAGRLDWLRGLHRSHSPVSGPFSTCMHRADAATVSYTLKSPFRRNKQRCAIASERRAGHSKTLSVINCRFLY